MKVNLDNKKIILSQYDIDHIFASKLKSSTKSYEDLLEYCEDRYIYECLKKELYDESKKKFLNYKIQIPKNKELKKSFNMQKNFEALFKLIYDNRANSSVIPYKAN